MLRWTFHILTLVSLVMLMMILFFEVWHGPVVGTTSSPKEPIWFLTLKFALLPAYWLLTYRKRGRQDRIKHGLCPTCGYDLRASPDACPECGAVAVENA